MSAFRAKCASINAMFPPAETPPIDIFVGLMLNCSTPYGEAMYCRAAKESRIPVGKGFSGTSRYATSMTATLARDTMCLQM
jgi:hypothetical protein